MTALATIGQWQQFLPESDQNNDQKDVCCGNLFTFLVYEYFV